MTEQQFLALHRTTSGAGINTSYTINVNYDNSVPQVPGYTRSLEAGRRIEVPNYIIGITVTRNARSVDGIQGVDIESILDGLQKVRFAFDGYDYALNIISRAYYPGAGASGGQRTTPYFYFRVTPFQLPTGAVAGLTDDPEFQENILVDFTPFIDDLEFLFTTYNTTYNNAQEIRRSYKIVVADRLQDTALPTNFDAIYEGTAEFAEVQDSLYSDTGWANGRYNGSKTSADNYSGLVPSIAGRAFRGEVFNGSTTYDTFCLLRNDSRLFEELFHTGPREEPDYNISPMGIYIPTLITTNTNTIEYVSGSRITGSIDRGDILILDNEKLKVRSVNLLADPPTVTVTRGWGGTTDAPHLADTEFYKIDRTDIIRFTNSRTKTSAIDNNIIYTETANITLFTDSYGTVYSQSLCPQTLLLGIDDDTPPPSDRRLKTNLTFIGTSPSGLNIYSFEYIDQEQFGKGLYQGVMSDEVPSEAVSIGPDGYDRVDYSVLDVEYKKIQT